MKHIQALHVWLDHVASQDEGDYVLVESIGGLYWAADMRSLVWSYGYTHNQAVRTLAELVEDEQDVPLPTHYASTGSLTPSENEVS